MGLFKWIGEYSIRRSTLIQLRHEIDYLRSQFEDETAGMKPGSDEFESAYSCYQNDTDLIFAQIGAIETRRMIEKALYWGAEIPQRPQAHAMDNDHWQWSRVLGGYHLTAQGQREMRHAVSEEIDIFYRPWISWLAVAISFMALIVSLLKP